MTRFLLPLALLGWATLAPAAAPPPIDIADDRCAPLPHAARLADGQLQVTGEPGRAYSGWLEEHGIDLQLGTPAGTWIDSAPFRYAREPVRLVTDADGIASVPVRIDDQQPDARLRWLPICGPTTWVGQLMRHAELRARPNGDLGHHLATLLVAARALAGSAADPATRGWLLFQLASHARGAQLHAEAAEWYRLAGQNARQHDDPVRVALATLGQGGELFSLGDNRAGGLLEAARAQARSLELPYPEAVAAHDLCLVLRVGGDAEAAAACLRPAIDAFAALGLPRNVTRGWRNLAHALLVAGRYRESRDAVRRAGELAAGLDDPYELALTLRQEAQLARWSGDFERALALLREVARLLAEHGAGIEVAQNERLIADTYALAGERVRAEQYYERAIDLFDQLRASARGASARAVAARNLFALGRSDAAIALLTEAMATLQAGSDPGELATAALQLARMHHETGDDRAAAAQLALAERSRASLPWIRQAGADLLRLRLDGRLAAAESFVPALLQQALEGGHLLFYLELAELLLEARIGAGNADAAANLAATALRIGEPVALGLRSPALRHALLERLRPFAMLELALQADGPLAPEPAWRALAALERLRWIEQQPASRSARHDDALDDLERLLGSETFADASSRLRQHEAMLALHAADHGARPAPGAGIPALERPTLAEGDALLVLLPEPRRLTMLVSEGGRWRLLRAAAPIAEIRARVRQLRSELAGGHGNLDRLSARVDALADAIGWQALLTATPDRLLVLADTTLASIPWDLLPAPAATGVLADHAELVLLQSLRGRAPVTPTAVVALAAAAGEGAARGTLEQAAAEPAAVLRHWPGTRRQLGLNDGRSGFEALLQRPDTLLHVASHGRADSGLEEESGLWLQDLDATGPQFVSAVRIRRMAVRLPHVVLSACESGYSGADASFGVGGVAGSLVDAGAATVVATRWPVSDRAALVFSMAYHEALAAAPQAPAAALRAGQRALRAAQATRHPSHWAAWFLLQSGPDRPAAPAVAAIRN